MTEVWAGLTTGAVYAFIALGYNVTYLAGGVINFAQAYFLVLGTFVAYWGLEQHDLSVALVFVIALVVAGLGGFVEERLAIRPLRRSGGSAELVTMIGFSTIITGALVLAFGSNAMPVSVFHLDTTHEAFGGRFQPLDIVLIAAALVLGFGLHLLTHRTRIGLAALAQTDDREAAQLRGINVSALSIGGFIIAAALAGVLGPIVVEQTFASASIAVVLAVKGFVVLVLGGVGSHRGVLVAGFTVGLVEAFGSRYVGPSYRDDLVFLLFVAVLMAFPNGISGKRRARAV